MPGRANQIRCRRRRFERALSPSVAAAAVAAAAAEEKPPHQRERSDSRKLPAKGLTRGRREVLREMKRLGGPWMFNLVMVLLLDQLSRVDSLFTMENAHGRKMSFSKKHQMHDMMSGSGPLVQSSLTTSAASIVTKPSFVEGDVKAGRFIENQFEHRGEASAAPAASAAGGSEGDSPSRVNAKLDHVHLLLRRGDGQRKSLRGGKEERKRHLRHLVFKFGDLPPWHDRRKEEDNVTRHHSTAAAANEHVTSYDPVAFHILAQSLSYPDSNSLSQSDRDYFRMIRSENGLSNDIGIFKRGSEEDEHQLGQSTQAAKINQSPRGGNGEESHQNGDEKSAANESRSQLGKEENFDRLSSSYQVKMEQQRSSSSSSRPSIPKFVYHRVPANYLHQHLEDRHHSGKALVAISLPRH